MLINEQHRFDLANDQLAENNLKSSLYRKHLCRVILFPAFDVRSPDMTDNFFTRKCNIVGTVTMCGNLMRVGFTKPS